jgi:hypothetical protein
MLKAPKPCIFCGEYGNQTKEHVLARWLEEIFPRNARDTHTFGVIDDIRSYKPVEEADRLRLMNKQGRAHTLKARVVCEPCNGGWLGNNQVDAKPYLSRLIRGEFIDLKKQGQAAVALWTVRAAMVAEFLHEPIAQNIDQEHRTLLMEGLAPPRGWFVWIGGYGGVRPIVAHELISGQTGILTAPGANGPGPPFYIHGVTIGLGRLIIYAAGTNLPEQDFSVASDLLMRIWPPLNDTILWPPALLIDDEQEARISRELMQTFPLTVPSGWTLK